MQKEQLCGVFSRIFVNSWRGLVECSKHLVAVLRLNPRRIHDKFSFVSRSNFAACKIVKRSNCYCRTTSLVDVFPSSLFSSFFYMYLIAVFDISGKK